MYSFQGAMSILGTMNSMEEITSTTQGLVSLM